jgi:hypothetical protein
MLASAGLWFLVIAYVGGILAPRLYWLLAGKPCPHCQSGRVSFQGLVENPWRRLRSWWQCDQCHVRLHESRWGRLTVVEKTPALAEVEEPLAA